MKITIIEPCQNAETGWTLRSEGEKMDVRRKYAATLIANNLAIEGWGNAQQAAETPETVGETSDEEIDVMTSPAYNKFPVSALRKMASTRGLYKKGMRKADIVRALTEDDLS